LHQPILIQSDYLRQSDYPVRVAIDLKGSEGVETFDFDVLFVYDEQE
jgi:hypothetical protein